MREVSHRGPNKREFAGNIGRTGDGRNDGVSAGAAEGVRAVAEGGGGRWMERDGTFFGGVFSVPSGAGRVAGRRGVERLERDGTFFRGVFSVPTGRARGARTHGGRTGRGAASAERAEVADRHCRGMRCPPRVGEGVA
ncbi:hypothetical protein [Azospirillum endophyticum]